jgi:hypothetical protein
MKREAPHGILGGGAKTVAAVASTGAALVSIITFLNGWGLFGAPAVRENVANMGAKWIGIRPAVDTARSINDTLHFAAAITDKNGSVLESARPTWTTENPQVATVGQDGSVIARGPGATTILALVGELTARSRVVVHQTVSAVRVAGDSAIALAEGDTRTLDARAFDKRGWVVPRRSATWKVADGAAASIDSAGTVVATDVGRAILSVTIDGVSAQTLVNVAPAPSAIALVKGDSQRATAGGTLRDRIIVRVLNRRGRPVEGTLVRFKTSTDDGLVDPAAVVTDVDGRARTSWTLASRPGRQRLLATVERVDSALSIVAEAEPSAENARLIALRDTLAGVVGQTVEGIVGVRLTDSTGRAMPDVPVSWTSLDGAVQETGERTDSLGESRVTWTLGRKAVTQRLRARVAGLEPVLLNAMARHGSPTTIAVERAKYAKPDDPRSVPVVAIVKDTFGNVVPRATVRWLPRAGTVAVASIESDSMGRAAMTWTLAPKGGEQQLIASLRGAQASDTLVVRAPAMVVKQAGKPRRSQ